MKEITIIYNPYKIHTEILLDGERPKTNSSLNVAKRRLQEWIDDFPGNLYDECLEKEYLIKFTGTLDDFHDIEKSFEKSTFNIKYEKTVKPSVETVEKEIHDIFSKIQKGPIDELRDPKILQAFEKAENQEFEVNVVATMSAGKSTLINALLSKRLMPAQKEATTATIVKIKDSDSDVFSATAYDQGGALKYEYQDLQLEDMRKMNQDKDISEIMVNGRIPFLKKGIGKANKVKLVLVDTPGPNNSNDSEHKVKTYDMLKNSDKSLVLYVINSEQFGINDDASFLNDVCEEMKKCGKKSKDRFIFVVNKLDTTDPEEYNSNNCIEDNLSKVKSYIEKKGVKDPNIFPVSALVALDLRIGKPEDDLHAKWPQFKKLYEKEGIFKFEQYYQFSHLPAEVKEHNNAKLEKCTLQEELDLHSGIKPIEQAIELYIDKYARPSKVYDLICAFNDRLTQVKAIENLKLSLSRSKDAKDEVLNEISKLEDKITKAKEAKGFTNKLGEMKESINDNVSCALKEIVRPMLEKISDFISSATHVPIQDARRQCDRIQSECTNISSKMISDVNSLLKKQFRDVITQAIEEFKSYLSELNIDEGKGLHINAAELVAGEFNAISDLIQSNTIEEHQEIKKKEKIKVFQKSNRHWYNLWLLGFGHGDRYVDEMRDVTEIKKEEFVDMRAITDDYLLKFQEYLQNSKKDAEKYMKKEISELMGKIERQTQNIEGALSNKLHDLENAEARKEDIESEIHKKEKNLQWLESIQKEVNDLIDF